MRDAFISELTEAARVDPDVFLVVGDLGFSVIEEFQAEFPDRFLNAGVAEQTMLGAASGLAAAGYKPFVYSIGNFPTMRAVEQIRNDVCYHDRHVTVVAVGGGFSYGYLGYTHHALEDISVMRALPRMQVLSPSDPIEARALTRFAVEAPGPKYLRLGKNREPHLHDDALPVHGPCAIELFPGTDVALFVTGSIASVAIEAREELAKRGVSARVVSVMRIKPLDDSIATVAHGIRGIVTVEEHSPVGGLGSAVLEFCAQSGLSIPTRIVGASEAEIGRHIGSTEYMRAKTGLGVSDIIAAAEGLL